ncbi:hypothetical protein B0T21DRAFT_412641 [Apiosordaria backusii]|uniref:Uncharacterized protein n=1 Tax=Apiosordaria backusii TaxID=314023 RepID=A0AA40BDU8_9PEZI|nr:hypothetical protein B0T21DRAFT_412641 [Apiosordaria backusii]
MDGNSTGSNNNPNTSPSTDLMDWEEFHEQTAALLEQQHLENLNQRGQQELPTASVATHIATSQWNSTVDNRQQGDLLVPREGPSFPERLSPQPIWSGSITTGHGLPAVDQNEVNPSTIVPPGNPRRILTPRLRKPSQQPPSSQAASPQQAFRPLQSSDLVAPQRAPGHPPAVRPFAQQHLDYQHLLQQHLTRQNVGLSQHHLAQQCLIQQRMTEEAFDRQRRTEQFVAQQHNLALQRALPQQPDAEQRSSQQLPPHHGLSLSQHMNVDSAGNRAQGGSKLPQNMSIAQNQPYVNPDTVCTHRPPGPPPRLWNGESITDLINHSLSKIISNPAFQDRDLTYDDLKSLCGYAIRRGFIEMAGINPDQTHAVPRGLLVPYTNPNPPNGQPLQQAPGIGREPWAEGRVRCLECKKKGKDTWLKVNSFDGHNKAFHSANDVKNRSNCVAHPGGCDCPPPYQYR